MTEATPPSDFRQVIFISPGGRLQGGGLGTMTREMEAGLNARGKKTWVLNTRNEGSVLRSLYETPIALIAFLALIASEKKTVVHVQMTQRLSVAREGMFVPLARLLGRRVVLHHHGAEFPDFVERSSPLWRRITSGVCRSADVNIVLGRAWADLLRETLGVEDRKIVLGRRRVAANVLHLDGPDPRRYARIAWITRRTACLLRKEAGCWFKLRHDVVVDILMKARIG